MTNRKKGPPQLKPNRWSIPSWQHVASYAELTKHSYDRWRWEFLRRDAEYWKEWENQKARNHPFCLAVEGDPKDEAFDLPYYPEDHEDRWGDIWRFVRKYGLTRLLDPSVAHPKHLRFYYVPFPPEPHDIPELKNAKRPQIPMKLQYPSLAWFDLWKSIDSQLEHYAQVLKREQRLAFERLDASLGKKKKKDKEGKEKKGWIDIEVEAALGLGDSTAANTSQEWPQLLAARRDRSPSPEKLVKFLRVLDARSRKIPWLRIARKIVIDPTDKGTYTDEQLTSRAKQTYYRALDIWWKIPIERPIGPPIGLEDLQWQHAYSVVPPAGGKTSLLSSWLDLLHPRLRSLLLAPLS